MDKKLIHLFSADKICNIYKPWWWSAYLRWMLFHGNLYYPTMWASCGHMPWILQQWTTNSNWQARLSCFHGGWIWDGKTFWERRSWFANPNWPPSSSRFPRFWENYELWTSSHQCKKFYHHILFLFCFYFGFLI